MPNEGSLLTKISSLQRFLGRTQMILGKLQEKNQSRSELGQVMYSHSITLDKDGLLQKRRPRVCQSHKAAKQETLGFELRPAQLQSPNSFLTQPYLHTTRQAPWQAISELLHSTPGHKNHCPPTPSLTVSRLLVLPTKLGWLGRQKRAGREGEERSSSSKDPPFSVTSRSRGLWCEFPKIPKLTDTSPAPYLTNEETEAQRAEAKLFWFIQQSPSRARVGTRAPWLQCQVQLLLPPQQACPLLKMLCGVLKLRMLVSHSFPRVLSARLLCLGKETPDIPTSSAPGPQGAKRTLKGSRGTVTALRQTGSLSTQNKDQIHHLGSLQQLPSFPRDLIGLQATNAPSDSSGPRLGWQEESPLFSSPEGPKLDQMRQREASSSSFCPRKWEDRKPLLCHWEGKVSCNHRALLPCSYGDKNRGGTPSLRDAKGV